MILHAATGDAVALIEDGVVELALEGSGAQCLTRDPADPGVLFAGCRGGGLWRSDGGRAWKRLSLPQDDVFSVAVSPADGSVYAGTEPSMLFRSGDGGVTWSELSALRELPSATTWSFPPRPWTSHVRWIAPSPHDAELLLAGIELGGLMRSGDGGATWADHRPGAQRDVHALAWHPTVAGRAYEAGGGGAAWSRDAGETWEPADEGRDRHYTWALAVDPDDPDRWWVSASTGPLAAHTNRPAEAVLYRWEGGGPWRPLDRGLPSPVDAMPYALVARADGLHAGLADGTIFSSGDGGENWEQLELSGSRLQAVLALV